MIGVCFGGPSPEHDVSVLTGLQAARTLVDSGRQVTGLYWARNGVWYQVPPTLEPAAFAEGPPQSASEIHLVASPGWGFVQEGRFGRLRRLELDSVVVCCHGGPGEDGSLQAALDLAGVAYTGPSVHGAALGMDKLAFGALARAWGMPVLERELLSPKVGFGGPYILKPRFGGSSIGVEVAADLEAAQMIAKASPYLRQGAVVEPYRPDLFDLNVGVRSWPVLELSALEKPLRSDPRAEILSFADKYRGGAGMASAPRELPARVPAELEAKARDLASRVAEMVGLRGVARVDFLASEEGELYVNEVNTIPGSLGRYLWVDPPIPFLKLLEDLLEEAKARPAASLVATGADGALLRSAASIAAKLA